MTDRFCARRLEDKLIARMVAAVTAINPTAVKYWGEAQEEEV
ncbi:MAG: hypothetical protein ACOZF2_14585 [Thermodesulfobacteriota bacterium]